MKSLSFLIGVASLSGALLFATPATTETIKSPPKEAIKNECYCEKCNCTIKSNCGCFSKKGCICADHSCSCGKQCACGGCQCSK